MSDILLKCLHFPLCVRDENMVGVRIGCGGGEDQDEGGGRVRIIIAAA